MIYYFFGLDVGQRSTSICVIDPEGKIICEGAVNTHPDQIHGWLRNRIDIDKPIRIGLEAGNMSAWLHRGLVEHKFDVTCMETFQAHRFLATFRNKTDRNDARGLAQLLRMGGEDFLKVVKIRSQVAQETRTLLSMRHHLVKQKVSMENHIAGILKPFGVVIPRNGACPETFCSRVVDGMVSAKLVGVTITHIVKPSLELYRIICRRIEPMTERVEEIVEQTEMAKRFTDIPGVGPVTALSFFTAIDDPVRFRKSSDVAAYFGLTPKQY